jgi:cyanophycinase-like exopeptidase
VPLADGKLARDQRGALAMPIVQNLQQVAVLFAGGGDQAKIIKKKGSSESRKRP